MHSHSSAYAHRPCARGRVVACPAPCRGCPAGRIAAHRRRVIGPTAVSWPCAARTPLSGVPRASQRIAARKRSYRGRRAPCRDLASWPCRDTAACLALAPCQNTPRCIAIQFLTASFPAIQFVAYKTRSQYNWAVAQISSAPFFFSFFFTLFILLLFFSHFQLLENTKKIYTNFFFSFSRILNKLIKIYFIHFSSVLHPVKP